MPEPIIATTTVYLTPADVEAFLLFQEHYEVFKAMKENGIFDIQYGKAILNFAHGELQNIIKEEIVYKKT